MRRKLLAVATVMMALLVATTPAAAVSAGDLNHGADGAPNPYVSADVTVDSYDVGWGDDPQYEDDSGEVTDLPAAVNSSDDHDELGNGHVNEFSFTVTDIEFADAGEFPRNSNDSALHADEWTTSGATMSNVTTAPGVDAVEFAASTAGDSATYDRADAEITSDAEKRYAQFFYDLTASGASTVTATIHDGTDGDTATVELYNASGDTSAMNVGANTTGEGKAMQVQVGKLDASGGDSTIQEIGKVVVSADGAANVDFSAINLEKTSKYKLGERYHDDDDDDELETETIYEATGELSVHSVDTLGSTFDDATIHGLTFPAHFEAAQLSGDDVAVSEKSGEDAGYPNWDKFTTIQYRLTLPDAYDLSYSNAELKADQKHTEPHYVSVQYAEGTSDTAFDDIEDSSWSDITSSFSSEGKEVSIDTTVQPGTSMVLEFDNVWTSSEYQNLTSGDSGNSGGGGGIFSTGSGGILSMILSPIGAIVAVISGLAGRAMGWF